MASKRRTDEYFMSRALSLARRGTGKTAPNPLVGCILVREGRVLGEGYHAACGEDHAEVAALKDAARRGEDVRGATAYVNLEPCSHVGRTPPCAPRLVAEGVSRVVVGMPDPNPRVSGRGLQVLRDAGVEVTMSCLEEDSRWLNRGFIRLQTLKRPWVALKAATGLDGRLALENGESRWITDETSRSWAHQMRAEHDAVMVGVGTVLSDDPALTVRHTEGANPRRVVLDTRLATPPASKVISDDGLCLILTQVEGSDEEKERRAAALAEVGAEVVPIPGVDGRLDLCETLAFLAERGVARLMVEGGPTLLGAFMARELADELRLFSAPRVMGAGLGLGTGLNFTAVDQAPILKDVRLRPVGRDVLFEGRFACSPDL